MTIPVGSLCETLSYDNDYLGEIPQPIWENVTEGSINIGLISSGTLCIMLDHKGHSTRVIAAGETQVSGWVYMRFLKEL